MKNTVIIKGNKYGITVVLDKDVAFSQLLTDLSNKLENAEDFFDSEKQLAITFEGRELSNEEMDELLYTIQNHSKLNIQYVMDENSEVEATFFDIIQTAHELEADNNKNTTTDIENDDLELTSNHNDYSELTDSNSLYEAVSCPANLSDNSGLFYKGTLRSGQSLEAKDSLIIIGDVNPGASVTAGGSIVILGTLKGSVLAGAGGNRNAFVMALSMNPISIQIADVIAENTSTKKTPKFKRENAMIATVVNNRISIEMV